MRVILVLSGKGGVGKSTVAIGLAQGLLRRGYKVGLLDADLENPCLPVLAAATRPGIQENGKLAPTRAHGLQVFSIGASLDRDLPVLVGETMKVGIVEEMLTGIDWGELDYLVIDTPPGSSAEVKTIITNSHEVAGAIVVTHPSEVSYFAVRRTFGLLLKYQVRVLGVVENMVGTHFGSGAGDKLANLCGTQVLARIPLTAEIRELGDRSEELPSEPFNGLVEEVLKVLSQ